MSRDASMIMFGTYIDKRIAEKFRKAAKDRYEGDLRTPLEEALLQWVSFNDDLELQEYMIEDRKNVLREART